MNRFLFLLSSALFVLSILIHANAILKATPYFGGGWIFIMHFATIAISISSFSRISKRIKSKDIKWFDFSGTWKAQKEILYDGLPNSGKFILMGCFVYAFLNFAILLGDGGGYSISTKAGKHYLRENGKPEVEITDAQYQERMDEFMRAFSGHWMLFCAISASIYYRMSRIDQQGVPATMSSPGWK